MVYLEMTLMLLSAVAMSIRPLKTRVCISTNPKVAVYY